jgi:maltose-binding protein MalE
LRRILTCSSAFVGTRPVVPLTAGAIRKSAVAQPFFRDYLAHNPIAQVGIDQLKYLHGQPINPADAVIWNGLVQVLQQAETSATMDPKRALADLQSQVDEYLKNYRR